MAAAPWDLVRGILSQAERVARRVLRAVKWALVLFITTAIAVTAIPVYRISEVWTDLLAINWFSYSIAIHTLRWLETTFLPHGETIIALGPWDAFLAVTYIGAGIAAMVTVPYVTFLILRFAWKAMRPRERRSLLILGPLSVGLFLTGLYVGFLTLPYLYEFGYAIQGPAGVAGTISLNEFIEQTLLFLLTLAIAFEIPIICYGLGVFGVLSAATMRKGMRPALVGTFAAAWLVSPGVGGGLIELPMGAGFFGLYLLGYWMVRGAERRRERRKGLSILEGSHDRVEPI